MCQFPARVLLEQMRQVARDADSSKDPAQITYAAGYIKATCDLRLFHEDLTGCQCWYEAVNNSDFELELQQAARSAEG